jgi:hypothetical protein
MRTGNLVPGRPPREQPWRLIKYSLSPLLLIALAAAVALIHNRRPARLARSAEMYGERRFQSFLGGSPLVG